MRIFRKYGKRKPKTTVVFYVENFCITGKPEYMEEIKKKPRKEFGIYGYVQLRKL